MMGAFWKRKPERRPVSRQESAPIVNIHLEQWEARGRLAVALGFQPQDSFKTITGYDEPGDLLRELNSSSDFPAHAKMLTELAIADQMLFGGEKRKNNLKLGEGPMTERSYRVSISFADEWEGLTCLAFSPAVGFDLAGRYAAAVKSGKTDSEALGEIRADLQKAFDEGWTFIADAVKEVRS